MDILAYFDITMLQLVMVFVVALFVGLNKAGLSGITLVVIPLMAAVWGGRQSTGLMLLMLLTGDLFAVRAYYKGVVWTELRALLPAAVAGIGLGALTGQIINDHQFKLLIAIVVILCLGLMIFREISGTQFKVPHNALFIFMVGMLSGFSSMVGNAAGPIFAVYLLAIGLNKKNYLGTSAVFFFIVNLLKLPIQIFVWHSLTWKVALLVLLTLPLVFAGIRLGIWLVTKLNEKTFRWLILGLTAVSAVRLFF
ncbi:MAG: sulfite exporter TauE/SafE family protein [Ruminococcaceae bacterium]|nr:sulfite exporter TauE/SafE family protein [Oscillospiraceae bacterium]